MQESPTLDLANDNLRSSVGATNAENGASHFSHIPKTAEKP